jgi:hypothetical protein
MKKLLALMLVAGLAATAKAELVNWEVGGGLQVEGVAAEAGWTVRMYQAIDAREANWQNVGLKLNLDGSVAAGSSLGTANDTFLGHFTETAIQPGFGTVIIAKPALTVSAGNVYSVLFDIANTRYAVIDNLVSVPVGTGNPGGTPAKTYTIGTFPIVDTVGNWVVIPEPGTVGMMGLAGIGMFLARKKTRK